MNKKKTIKRGILLFAIVFLVLFLKNVDFLVVFENIQKVGWKFGLLLLITGFGYFLGSTAWCFSFRSLKLNQLLLQLFVYRLIGESLAVINPTSVIAGDASKVYFLQKKGVPIGEASSATLTSRVLLLISLIFLIILTSIFFIDGSSLFQNDWLKIIILTVIAIVGLAILFLFVSEKMYLYRLVKYVFSYSKRLKGKAESVHEINQAMSDYFKNYKGKFIIAFSLSVLHWMTGAVEFFIILNILEFPISILDALVMEMGVMLVKSAGAFVPGQIGIEEKGNEWMLLVIGAGTGGLWVVVSILRRGRQIFWLTMGALFYFIFNYRNKKEVLLENLK